MTEEKETETSENAACDAKKGCPLCACVHSIVTRRVIARLTDYIIWGMLSLLALYALVRVAVATESSVLAWYFSLPYSLHLFLYLAFIVYIFVEAGLIAAFGKTLGKALAGLTVTDENGEKLGFKQSLHRAWLVYFKGLGLFLPLISIIMPLFWLFRYRRTKTFAWDVGAKTKETAGVFRVSSKLVFLLFYGFLAVGFYTAQKNAREFPDIPSEETILYSYLRAIEPYLKDSLEESALLTPDKVGATLANLQKAKEVTEQYQNEYLEQEKKFMEKASVISNPEAKELFENTFAAQKERVMGFFFLQQIRLSLFENIVAFFKEAEGQYTFENGQPVFKTPELTKRYEEYMQQMSEFLNGITAAEDEDLTAPDDDEITVDEIIVEGAPEKDAVTAEPQPEPVTVVEPEAKPEPADAAVPAAK